MEQQQRKEDSHKDNKTFRKCSLCISSSTCGRCKGLCVFSPAIPDKYIKSRAIRQMTGQKFFKKEYELIKAFLNNSQSLEEEQQPERTETYFLLKKFHELDENQQKVVLKTHGADSCRDRYCQTNRSNKVLKFYNHCRNDKPRRSSRQEKNANLINFNEGNLYLQ